MAMGSNLLCDYNNNLFKTKNESFNTLKGVSKNIFSCSSALNFWRDAGDVSAMSKHFLFLDCCESS